MRLHPSAFRIARLRSISATAEVKQHTSVALTMQDWDQLLQGPTSSCGQQDSLTMSVAISR